ncbi:MAG: hypothetical protein KDD56_02705 [Bdellovibrionales bacterium]|nr:hypothetical protein [Bdellovibrionales bacterium]
MIWKRKKHPLPKFPTSVASVFRNCCEVVSSDNIPVLRSQLENSMNQLRASISNNPTMDLNLATSIYKVCIELLDNYDRFSTKEQGLIIGAVRYFAVAEDPFPDEIFFFFFDDDFRVLNHVLEKIGWDEYYIDVPE